MAGPAFPHGDLRERGTAAGGALPGRKGGCVLVAGANRTSVRALVDILRRAGHEVLTETDPGSDRDLGSIDVLMADAEFLATLAEMGVLPTNAAEQPAIVLLLSRESHLDRIDAPGGLQADDYLDLAASRTLVEAKVRTLVELARHRQEAGRVAETEERLRLLVEATGLGTWDVVDPKSGRRTWSPEFCALLGLPADQPSDPKLFSSLIHPDDRGWVNDRYRSFFAGESGGGYQAEFRIRRADNGAERWVQTLGRAYFDTDGMPVRAFGTLMDVTERKQSEEQLRASEQRFRLLSQSTLDAVVVHDGGTVLDCNDAFVEMFGGVAREEMIGRRISTFASQRSFRTEPSGPGHVTRLRREDVGLRRDGSSFPAEFVTRELDRSGRRLRIAVIRDLTERKRSEAALQDETRALETLNRACQALGGELDLDRLVQAVTDAGVELTGAEFGAFFYNVVSEAGESYTLYALSGVRREDFERYPMPRNTAVFAPTFHGEGIVRSSDILADPRYGQNPPHAGMPDGHLPVRSYLAVPVISRSGEVLGGLFFGHAQPGVFTDRAERIVGGLSAQAAVAIDNARLFQAAQTELDVRRKVEAHQKMLLDELNHRVKNTLATVQSLALQTQHGTDTALEFQESFNARLLALSQVHDLLTRGAWQGAQLRDVVEQTLAPYAGESGEVKVAFSGPEVRLGPNAAVTLNMAFHELATNAAKYGALSAPGGRVNVAWIVLANEVPHLVSLEWTEADGPPVAAPRRRGFGTRLLERGIAHELEGEVRLDYAPTGMRCLMRLPISTKVTLP